MLKRSVNPSPTNRLTSNYIETDFLPSGEWRLYNFLQMCATIANEIFANEPSVQRENKIGPTPFRVLAPVQATVTIGDWTGILTIQSGEFFVSGNTADPDDENGKIEGGNQGDGFIMHRTAGRIGPSLEPYEQALIPKRAGPFFSHLQMLVVGDSLEVSGEGSQHEALRWPTARVYEWNSNVEEFHLLEHQQQVDTPFEWIDLFGTPWP